MPETLLVDGGGIIDIRYLTVMSDSTISRKINPPVACVSKWIGCVARAATLGPPMGGVLLRVSGRFIEIIEAKENGIDTFMKYVETSGSQEEMPYY